MGWVIACLLSVPVARWSPVLAMGLLVLAGWLQLSSWARRLATPKNSLRHILLGSYVLQLAVTGLFFAASWNAWPLWRSQQLGSGFWQFAIDAPTYHLNATRIMDAFRLHRLLPGNIAAPEFAAFVALIYAIWGIQSLFICLLNAWVRGVAVIFAYSLGRRLLNAQAGRRAALLVGFWPSLFIWSSQLLRETVCLSILLGVLYGLVALWGGAEKPASISVRLRLVVGIAAGILLLTQVRWYLALMLWMTGLAVCLLALIRRALWGKHGVGDAVLAFVVVMLAFGVGRFQDPMRWLPVLMPLAHNRQLQPHMAVGPPSAVSPNQQTLAASAFWAKQEVVHLEHQSLSVRSDARPEVRQLWAQLKEAMEATPSSGEAAATATPNAFAQEPTTTQSPSSDQGRFEWGHVGPKFGDWQSWRLINWISGRAAKNLYATRWASLERAHTVIAPKWDTSTMIGTLKFLPYGVLSAILAPWPSQWFDGGGFTGMFKSWSSVEVLFIYMLFTSFVLGIVRALARLRPAHVGILFIVFLGLTFLSLTVATVGTMFRLRLNFLIPLAILGCAVESPPAWFAGLLWYNWKPFVWRGVPPDANSQMPAADTPIRVLRIITRMNIGGPAIHVSLLSAGLDPKRLPTCVVVGSPDASEGDLSDLLQGWKGRIIRLPALRRPLRPWADAVTLAQLLRVMWRERPQILHTHMAKAGALGRVAGFLYNTVGPGRAPSARLVLVHTFHGHVLEGYFSSWTSRMFVMIERWLAHRTDCLVAVSKTIQSELLKKGIGRPEQWRVIPLGLDLGQLAQVPPANDSPVMRVGMVGRLVPIKNPQLFLEALKGVIHSQPEPSITGVIVGDGPLRRSLEEDAKRLGVASFVRFTGWRRDLEHIYAGLDATCLTSWNEGTPVAIIEAMAAGRSVVATDVGGVRDVLEPPQAEVCAIEPGSFRVTERGVLIRPGDVEGLAAALRLLASDGALRQRLGAAARTYVVEHFSAERLCRDMAALYHQLLAEKEAT